MKKWMLRQLREPIDELICFLFLHEYTNQVYID